MVKILSFHYRGARVQSLFWVLISQATQCGQKKKKKSGWGGKEVQEEGDIWDICLLKADSHCSMVKQLSSN